MAKKIKDWLLEIKDPTIRGLALQYMEEDDITEPETIQDALQSAFNFSNTEEGILFWLFTAKDDNL